MELPLKIDGAIVVEGKYDRIKLAHIADCPIITTDGFSVFKSDEKKALLRWYAKNGGITILTDSDSAGFRIRGYIKGIISDGEVRCAYIPDVYGKEKRKREPSAEGKLGVEGVSDSLIVEALLRSGAVFKSDASSRRITRADLYEDGLFGRGESSKKRAELLRRLCLPEHLSTSGLLDVLNSAMSYEEYKAAVSD